MPWQHSQAHGAMSSLLPSHGDFEDDDETLSLSDDDLPLDQVSPCTPLPPLLPPTSSSPCNKCPKGLFWKRTDCGMDSKTCGPGNSGLQAIWNPTGSSVQRFRIQHANEFDRQAFPSERPPRPGKSIFWRFWPVSGPGRPRNFSQSLRPPKTSKPRIAGKIPEHHPTPSE